MSLPVLIYLFIAAPLLFWFFYHNLFEEPPAWLQRMQDVQRDTMARQDEILRRTIDRLKGLE